jgi:2-dehydro-3-deoxy-D-arabinonate dehydratase
MRLGQIRWNNKVIAAVFDSAGARPIPDYTLHDLLMRADAEKVALRDLAQEHAAAQHVQTPPVIPIYPREVWGCGLTYDASNTGRPELFFKGTARVCVGLNKNVGIRQDSTFTAPEPELAVVLGRNGQVLGYTIANDMTAVDIGQGGPAFLSQSKVFTGSCALGPMIVTPDELKDPYTLEMTCTITRGEAAVYSGSVNTSSMCRKIDELIEFLLRSNPVPSGSVLLTGHGSPVSEDARLQPGDLISIRIPEIGELVNTAVAV